MRWLSGIVLLALATPAQGQPDPRMSFLIKRLEKASDPRGRAQAALILGASGEPAAVAPLCNALTDAEHIVRSAAAQGLGELGEVSAVRCLKKHAGDANPEARAAIQKASATLERLQNVKPVLYVLLDDLKDERSPADPVTARLAEDRLRKELQKMGAVLAPSSENAKQARAVMNARKLKGYYLVPKLQNQDGALRLSLLGFSYPQKSLQGEVSARARGGDAAALIRALVPGVLKEASATFEWGGTP
jgi:bacterioferritin-associated ferredoxin